MASYPILFAFRDAVAGTGFVATVSLEGRVLMVEEDDGTWLYGVEPGGLAGHGTTAQEAHEDFRAGYRSVLDDLADEAEDFDSFAASTKEFLCTVNRPNEALWEASAILVGTGKLNLDWMPQRPAPRKSIEERIKIEKAKEPRDAINDPGAQAVQSLARAA